MLSNGASTIALKVIFNQQAQGLSPQRVVEEGEAKNGKRVLLEIAALKPDDGYVPGSILAMYRLFSMRCAHERSTAFEHLDTQQADATHRRGAGKWVAAGLARHHNGSHREYVEDMLQPAVASPYEGNVTVILDSEV